MRKKVWSLGLCLLLSFAMIKAQPIVNNKISGKVLLDNNRPAANATIFLLNQKDSSSVKLAVPDDKGYFEFENLKTGNYIVSVTHSGYKKYYSETVSINESKNNWSLPDILLQPGNTTLAGVQVEAKKPFIEKKLDRLVINVENSIVSAGSSVLEVLQRAPGVVVNEESSINLKGKQGVTIMIDGKPSPLSGTDLIIYLKGIPASSIEKIEIITNPSAKYDAAGNAGIINIRFKKDLRQGLNGNLSLNYGQGFYSKPSASSNLNFRKKKWNFFGNYSYARPKGYTRFYINRKFYNPDHSPESVFDQTSFIKQPYTSANGKFGVDFYASKKTIIGIMGNFNQYHNRPDGLTNSIITNPDGTLRGTSYTTNHTRDKRTNAFGNFNFKHTFDSTGKELTVDADYGKFNSTTRQNFYSAYFDDRGAPSTDNSLKNDQAGIITVQSVKADYTHPLKKSVRFEAGLKSSFVKTDNDVKFFNVVNGVDVPDASRTNHFIYHENVNAAYVNYSREFKKADIQFGLRAEQTQTHGKQITTGDKFSRQYIYLFPSFFISQKLTEAHQLSFSYSRRIDRPSYRQLNPFRIFVDPYTYVVGDPSLRPVLTNSFELAHTFMGKYITTLNYVQSREAITDIFFQDDASKISYQTPANLQNFDQYNISVTIPVTIKKWMNSSINASAYVNKYTSPLQGGHLTNSYTTWDINISNSFVFGKKGWTAELNGFYQSKMVWGLFIIRNLAQVSPGIQKVSANKKSVFKLAYSDIFKTNHIAVIVKYQNMDFHTNRTWDSRAATISYTYRFGRNTVARARQRTSGVEDEKRRAN